ncbi:MAG: quaternary ammonium transporter [Chloroflexi bacterium]|nr:quaternary ammonium transporter [Chloroflexota bacterium]
MSKRIVLFTCILLALLFMPACGASDEPKATIRVGSKDFTEQLILGEVYALLLENDGFKVERELALGGSPALQDALVTGEIDLYPEYTGTGLMTVLKLPVNTDPQQAYDTVAQGYKEQFNLVWLDPAPMNNTYVLVMTRKAAAQYGIETMSNMVAQASQLTMAGTIEFASREDGLPGIKQVYGDFELLRYIPIEPDLKYRALVDGDANVITGFGTDGEISAFDLVALQDDKQMYPPYQVTPVVRQEILDAHPEIRDLFNALAPLLTDATMQRLNYEVSGGKREPADVAKEFLIQQGLIETE